MTMSPSGAAGMTDETLMAYVDGELGAEEVRAVERAADADPAVAARIAMFRRTRVAAQQAFAGVRAAPTPERVTAVLRPRPSRAWVPQVSRGVALPLAASLVLAIGLGFLAGRVTAPEAGGLAAEAGSPAMQAALASQPSGVPLDVGSGRLTVTGTYDAGGGLCRAFSLESTGEALRGVACDAGQGWRPAVLVAVPAGDASVTASGTATAALDSYLDAAGAGAALDRAEEARRLGAAPR